jgi:hypothetical protein
MRKIMDIVGKVLIGITVLALLILKFSHVARAAEFTTIAGYDTSIVITGTIEHGDGKRLATYLSNRTQQGYPTEFVMLNSDGGFVLDAASMADVIVAHGAKTVVDRADMCVSACVLVFAAGRQRLYWPGAHIGVHSAFDGTNGLNAPGEDDANASVAVAKLYQLMGVPAAVIAKMITTPGNDIAWLTRADIEGWAIDAESGW